MKPCRLYIEEKKDVKKTATPKPQPKTAGERPLTETPNEKKPLGTKKVTVVKKPTESKTSEVKK